MSEESSEVLICPCCLKSNLNFVVAKSGSDPKTVQCNNCGFSLNRKPGEHWGSMVDRWNQAGDKTDSTQRLLCPQCFQGEVVFVEPNRGETFAKIRCNSCRFVWDRKVGESWEEALTRWNGGKAKVV